MAQELRIVLICDKHMAEGITVEGAEAYPLGGHIAELCAECAAPVLVALDLVKTFGRVDDKRGKRQTVTARQSQADDAPRQDWPCPACDYVSHAISVGVLRQHATITHHRTLEQLNGEPTPYACRADNCPLEFAAAISRVQHEMRGHGLTLANDGQ